MACCGGSPEETEAARRSREIDRSLRAEKDHYRKMVKILLLGAGESGKSTFLRQIRILHGEDFDEAARREFIPIIYGNVIKSIKILLEARRRLGIAWGDEAGSSRFVEAFAAYNNEPLDCARFCDYCEAIARLWRDSGIQETYNRRREYQIGDSTQYFMDRLDDIAQPTYVPTRQDVLCSRKATRGIFEYDFHIKGIPFKMVDVGGQRSQRTKWFQCFDEVTSIVFLVASSGFDQVLMEDRTTNRLVESINIFDTIINNKCFKNVSIILFLNKSDLLAEKVKTSDISQHFPSFGGNPHNLDDVQKFILEMFHSKRHDPNKQIYHHYTTATDTENIRVVFAAVKSTILEKNIQSLMLG